MMSNLEDVWNLVGNKINMNRLIWLKEMKSLSEARELFFVSLRHSHETRVMDWMHSEEVTLSLPFFQLD